MKKIILFTVVLAFLYNSSAAQNYLFYSKSNRALLLGPITETGLRSDNFSEWFTKNYDMYQVNELLKSQLEDKLSNAQIKIFMGTWCPDSRREVPAFLHILHAINFDFDNLSIIGVDYQGNDYKQSPGHEEEGLDIYRVPTFIFYEDSSEIGRIIESPVQSLEEDILSIYNGEYVPNYKAYYLLIKDLGNDNLKILEQRKKELLDKYSAEFKDNTKLLTLARVLYCEEQIMDCRFVLELQLAINPDNERSIQFRSDLMNKLGLSELK